MIIDSPHSRDLPALKQLWQQAFGDPEAFVSGFFDTGFAKERCRCLYADNTLAAALYWFDCRWQDQKIAYLYAIATDEAQQNKGFCKALMADTHALLKNTGYAGAILVPAEENLFHMYAKMGYRGFCPMKSLQVIASGSSAQLQTIDARTYARLRREHLPENSVLQEGSALAYLQTYATFYEGEGVLFCCSRDGDTVRFQEFLGDPSALPNILAALNAAKGILRQPGGDTPFAMYKHFSGSDSSPTYFGLPLD